MISTPPTRTTFTRRTNPAHALLAALQFLTRIPTPQIPYTERTLADSLLWFPVIGALVGLLAAAVNHLLFPHLSRTLSASCAVTFTVLLTGALHEDGLADCADAFGGHHSRERTLDILHDSRIGTYGAIALILSLAARILLLAALHPDRMSAYLICAHTLSRWASLPMSLLPAARQQVGQGAKLAQRMTPFTLATGTIFAFGIVIASLHLQAFTPILASVLVTATCAFYFKTRIQGVTGDCFGATEQLVEIAVLTCGAWT